ncbi:MAG: hypothetical protein ABI691_25195 [Ginsengibacter sp.]
MGKKLLQLTAPLHKLFFLISFLSFSAAAFSANTANYQAAAAAMGGDKLTSRVFWDIP